MHKLVDPQIAGGEDEQPEVCDAAVDDGQEERQASPGKTMATGLGLYPAAPQTIFKPIMVVYYGMDCGPCCRGPIMSCGSMGKGSIANNVYLVFCIKDFIEDNEEVPSTLLRNPFQIFHPLTC